MSTTATSKIRLNNNTSRFLDCGLGTEKSRKNKEKLDNIIPQWRDSVNGRETCDKYATNLNVIQFLLGMLLMGTDSDGYLWCNSYLYLGIYMIDGYLWCNSYLYLGIYMIKTVERLSFCIIWTAR